MRKNKSGFTLIELLVVIAIIGLLSTLSILALNTARARSRDAKRISDVKQMQTALEMYFNDNNAYPPTTAIVAGNPIATGTVTYMGVVPTAPTPADGTACATANSYVYTNTGAGSTYTIKYCLGSKTGGAAAGVHTATPAGITNP